ncbi:glucuronyl hydrolase [Paramyrothecium foliicola]|nr:glucuronyl hydrolase [Paramyrothecium foliicola]
MLIMAPGAISPNKSPSTEPRLLDLDTARLLPISKPSWPVEPVEDILYTSSSPTAFEASETSAALPELFAENIVAKVSRTAVRLLAAPSYPSYPVVGIPLGYPEIVPKDGPGAGQYDAREPEFWTCGFFPGTLQALLERAVKHPQALGTHGISPVALRAHLKSLCDAWSEPLHAMSSRTDTHDIGFIIMPALQRDWELTGNERSLKSIIHAAHSLASRYIPSAGVIRSWDLLIKKEITVTDMEDNALIIIDSLCNLNLLFYAAAHSGEERLAQIAETHARTLMTSHLRKESPTDFPDRQYQGQLFSSCHVANISPRDGQLKWQWTAQGYANGSTWARGQAWSILGYAQTYSSTKDKTFLEVACGAAEYFLYRLETAPACVETCRPATPGSSSEASTESSGSGRYVPLWDFDAPVDPQDPLRDSSAGIIAANGMLILAQSLRGLGRHALAAHFQDAAIRIADDTVYLSLSDEKARLSQENGHLSVKDVVEGHSYEAILKKGTANNNENARRRYADHGLVYADYYFVEFGNRLLDMGLA